jgi:hypothetical protein
MIKNQYYKSSNIVGNLVGVKDFLGFYIILLHIYYNNESFFIFFNQLIYFHNIKHTYLYYFSL